MYEIHLGAARRWMVDVQHILYHQSRQPPLHLAILYKMLLVLRSGEIVLIIQCGASNAFASISTSQQHFLKFNCLLFYLNRSNNKVQSFFLITSDINIII